MSKDFFFLFSFVIAFQFYALTCFDILQTSFSLMEKNTQNICNDLSSLDTPNFGFTGKHATFKEHFPYYSYYCFSIILFSVSWFFFHLIQYNLVSCFFFFNCKCGSVHRYYLTSLCKYTPELLLLQGLFCSGKQLMQVHHLALSNVL